MLPELIVRPQTSHGIAMSLMCDFTVVSAAVKDGLAATEPGSQIRFGYCDGGTVRLVGFR